jgi:hypothetical protein
MKSIFFKAAAVATSLLCPPAQAQLVSTNNQITGNDDAITPNIAVSAGQAITVAGTRTAERNDKTICYYNTAYSGGSCDSSDFSSNHRNIEWRHIYEVATPLLSRHHYKNDAVGRGPATAGCSVYLNGQAINCETTLNIDNTSQINGGYTYPSIKDGYTFPLVSIGDPTRKAPKPKVSTTGLDVH